MTVASFVFGPATPYARQPVTFSDLSSGDPMPSSWLWSFGDGEWSSAQNPIHSYAAPGNYPVTLTVGGVTAAQTVPVHRAIVYNGIELSGVSPWEEDAGAVCNAKTLVGGGRSLQGSAKGKNDWEFLCHARNEVEFEALKLLKGQLWTLNIDGVLYPSVMLAPGTKRLHHLDGAVYYTAVFKQELA